MRTAGPRVVQSRSRPPDQRSKRTLARPLRYTLSPPETRNKARWRGAPPDSRRIGLRFFLAGTRRSSSSAGRPSHPIVRGAIVCTPARRRFRPMLAAADLTEIIANLSALNLQPTTAAQILAAVLAPLL